MEQEYLYVVFSATPLKIGKMIRTVTRDKYNHVSISLDPDLKTLYSYARYHKKAPLYGGFVCETPSRYKHGEKVASISVCSLPITAEQKEEIISRIENMQENVEKCRYNMVSAMIAPLSKRVFVPNCYTCIEFATSVIAPVFDMVKSENFYSVDMLYEILSEYEIFSGFYSQAESDSPCQQYEKDLRFYDVVGLSVKNEIKYAAAFLSSRKIG